MGLQAQWPNAARAAAAGDTEYTEEATRGLSPAALLQLRALLDTRLNHNFTIKSLVKALKVRFVCLNFYCGKIFWVYTLGLWPLGQRNIYI